MDHAEFHRAIAADPDEWGPWLVYADWLCDRGEAEGEFVQLLHSIQNGHPAARPDDLKERLRTLVDEGATCPGPEWGNAFGMQFKLLPPRMFTDVVHREGMPFGSLTGLWIGRTSVTRAQWDAVVQETGWACWRKLRGTSSVCTTLSDAIMLASVLTANELKTDGFPGRFVYTLPTEQQWQYACRAGTRTDWKDREHWELDQFAHFGRSNMRDVPAEIAPTPRPNAFGLFGMYRLGDEWCHERHASIWPGYFDIERASPDEVVRLLKEHRLDIGIDDFEEDWRNPKWSEVRLCLKPGTRHEVPPTSGRR